MKNFFFALCCVIGLNTNAQKPSYSDLPGHVVSYQPASSGQYIGSPSIAILPNGDYVASHDFFGPGSSEWVQARTRIYTSTDRGKHWRLLTEIKGAFWSNLFTHEGALYLLGPDRHHGTVLIRKSVDGGRTWTEPVNRENGLLLIGEFHCAPMPMLIHNGRIWRAMETAHGPIREWGKRYGAMMMSAPLSADLMNADSWTTSNAIFYDSTYLDNNFTGWLEGNAVAMPDGNVVNMLRVDDRSSLEEKLAMVHVSADGQSASFDPELGFLPFPGGSKKFAIRYDTLSNRYWTLSNAIPDSIKVINQGKNPSSLRNTLVLMSSSDLIQWETHKVLLYHPDAIKHGFQYVDWLVEDNDIVFLSRTAYDDGVGGANNSHDANFLTFHRIVDFRANLNSVLTLDRLD